MTSPAGLDLAALRAIAARRRGVVAYRHLLDRIAEHLDAHDGFVSVNIQMSSNFAVLRKCLLWILVGGYLAV